MTGIDEIPADEFACFDVVPDGQRRALCTSCALAFFGFGACDDVVLRVGEMCLHCGGVRSDDLTAALTDAVHDLIAAVLAGATAEQLVGVADDVGYFVARERWKDHLGPPPSQFVPGGRGCLGCLADPGGSH